MTKFILILSVCSFLTGECKNPIQPPVVYNDWAECAADASVKSLELLQKKAKIMLINIGWQLSMDVIQLVRLDNVSEMWQE